MSGKARSRSARQLADQAIEHHRRGATGDAEHGYRAALAIDPALPDGLHGIGLLALERGLPAQAIALIGRAQALRPDNALYALNLGHALCAQGHLEEARAAFAVACLRDAGDPRAHAALAAVLERLNRSEDAASPARTAIRLAADPAHAMGMRALLGRIALQHADWTQAIEALSAAVQENHADALSWHGLAVAHAAQGMDDQAGRCFRQVVALRPDDPAALANLGAHLFERNQLDEALAVLRQAIASGQPSAETSSNLGLVLLALGHLEDAEQILAAASRSAPDQAGIANNHGTALLELGKFNEAERCFKQIEAAQPGSRDAERARFNRGTLLLGTGRFAEGWPLFESRHAVLGRGRSPLAAWDGRRLDERSALLVEAEQGLGDVIQFLRYVPQAMRLARVVLRLPQPLLRLARQSLPGACIVLAAGDPVPPECVVRADLLSLPLLLRMEQPFWPGAYLHADPVPAAGTIGLCWSGSAAYRFDRRRSLPPALLSALGSAGYGFVALQPERAGEPALDELLLSRPALLDLAGTAALIAGLALVITVDTAVAHLAGAMGRPVWLLNRFGGDWRWRHGSRDAEGSSLWYPTLRLFEQDRPRPPAEAWQPVIDHVALALAGMSWAKP